MQDQTSNTVTVYFPILSAETFPEESLRILKEFVCPLCNGIPFHPKTDECGHIFCEKCLEIYLLKEKTCPVLNSLYKTPSSFPATSISKVFDIQRVYCLNRKRECYWEGKLMDLELHMKNDCNKQMIKCNNKGCDREMLREEYTSHISQCEFRLIKCKNCTKELPFNQSEKHQENCPKLKIKCVQCCGCILEREKMEYHIKTECDNTSINCPFKEIGCESVMKRKDINEHHQNFCIKHTVFLIKSLRDLKDNVTIMINKNISTQFEEMKIHFNTYIENYINNCIITSEKEKKKYNIKDGFLSQKRKSFDDYREGNLIEDDNDLNEKISKMREEIKNKDINNNFIEGLSCPLGQESNEIIDADMMLPVDLFDISHIKTLVKCNNNKVKFIDTSKKTHQYVFINKKIDPAISGAKLDWEIKFTNTGGWIGFGVCDKKQVIKNNFTLHSFEPKYYNGTFLFSLNGYYFNANNHNEFNRKSFSPVKESEGILKMSYINDKAELRFKLEGRDGLYGKLTKVYPRNGGYLTPCIVFLHPGDEVEVKFA